MIVLRAARTEAWIVPKLGASLARLQSDGKDYLRSIAAEPTSALDLAGFPMVPYCNRIENGTFRFMDRDVVLEPNFGTSAHPIHGHAWLGEWKVEYQSAAAASLLFDYEAGDWPWAYQARLHYVLKPRLLSVELLVKNMSNETMPAGLGFHPYFARAGDFEVVGGVSDMWEANSESLPTHCVPHDGTLLHASTSSRELDNCFGGFNGDVQMNVSGRPFLSMRASSSCQYLHLYAPRDTNFICLEPTTHAPNSLARKSHQRNLLPGDFMQIWVDFQLH